MLQLKNIKIDGNIITANYVPEGSETEIGFIKYDFIRKEVKEKKTTSFDEPFSAYLHHAKRALQKYVDNNDTVKERIVMWY